MTTTTFSIYTLINWSEWSIARHKLVFHRPPNFVIKHLINSVNFLTKFANFWRTGVGMSLEKECYEQCDSVTRSSPWWWLEGLFIFDMFRRRKSCSFHLKSPNKQNHLRNRSNSGIWATRRKNSGIDTK